MCACVCVCVCVYVCVCVCVVVLLQKSIKDSLRHPKFVDCDHAKRPRQIQLHVAYQALHEYSRRHGSVPKPRCEVGNLHQLYFLIMPFLFTVSYTVYVQHTRAWFSWHLNVESVALWFNKVLHNPDHVLHRHLPPVAHTSHNYNLRPRAHDRSLLESLTHLTD